MEEGGERERGREERVRREGHGGGRREGERGRWRREERVRREGDGGHTYREPTCGA